MGILARANRAAHREIKKFGRRRQMKKLGMEYVPPNFIFFPRFGADSLLIDAGCSHEADFSLHLIRSYGVRAFGVDPTKKHRPALARLESEHCDRFTHLPLAIAAEDATLAFHEPKTYESGSLLSDHLNMARDDSTRYEVEAVALKTLYERVGAQEIDMLKLDIEGAEYELLSKVTKDDLRPCKQILIEFHHHAIPRYVQADTTRAVERIKTFGFKAYSLDDHNYLFEREG